MKNNNNNNMGVLNKNENKGKQNKQIMILVVAIVAVIVIVMIVLRLLNGTGGASTKADISTILKEGQTKIIYIENTEKGKCSKCSTIKKYLDEKKINYVTYDASKYSDKEYKKMLQSIEINPSDFGYPAVVYIKDGKLYSNVINLVDTKTVETFIKDYDLTKVK